MLDRGRGQAPPLRGCIRPVITTRVVSGVLRKRFKLDYDILTLLVDKDNHFLYGQSIDKETSDEYIVRFELDGRF